MKKILPYLLITLIFCANFPAMAQTTDKLNMNTWEELPILHEGRVKPLDSFARITLKMFAKQENLPNLNASEWLAFSVFNPAEAVNLPLFKIRNHETYGLPNNKNRLYSYVDLGRIIEDNKSTITELLNSKDQSWTPEQANLIELYEYYILNTQILRSLSLILPLNLETNSTEELPKDFLSYKKTQQLINEKAKNIVRKKGTDISKYNAEEREVTFLSYQLNAFEKSAENNVLMRIIPANWNNEKSEWISPWAVIQRGLGSPQSAKYIRVWKDIANAYRNGDAENWEKTVDTAQNFFSAPKLKTEKFYNSFHLIQLALFFYIGTLFFVILQSLTRRNNSIIKHGIVTCITIGAIAHIIHIGLRIYILERPPVGTLYESILFVSLICVIGFAFLSWWQKNTTAIMLGSVSGILLLTTAQGFVGDDPMSTLAAVLNTNFWLGTHVICITIGYATCFIASLMAHHHLIIKWVGRATSDFFKQSRHNIKTMVILSLLLTTVGTILGGIWADQSWGRFWGWDPKENGALLIVLWLSWLLHGRISEHVTRNGFIVGTAFLSIIVILAWFGVNLLSVGLHSYGFISGVALGLTLFCVFETAFIMGLWYLGKDKKSVEKS